MSGDMKDAQMIAGSGRIRFKQMRDKDGQTPAHWAANGGNLQLVQWLEDSGAQVDSRDLKGQQVGLNCAGQASNNSMLLLSPGSLLCCKGTAH
jgi:ankyrin repeat protein